MANTLLSDYLTTHPFGQTGTVTDTFRADIVGLIGTLPSLEAVQTVGIGLKSRITTTFDGRTRDWLLVTGAADPTDPGQVAPLDFDAVKNNVYWVESL